MSACVPGPAGGGTCFRGTVGCEVGHALEPLGELEASCSITLSDQASYDRLVELASHPTVSVTVRRTILADPNLRWAPTLRAFLRQCWDILVWEFRGAAGMPRPADRVATYEIPAANLYIGRDPTR